MLAACALPFAARGSFPVRTDPSCLAPFHPRACPEEAAELKPSATAFHRVQKASVLGYSTYQLQLIRRSTMVQNIYALAGGSKRPTATRNARPTKFGVQPGRCTGTRSVLPAACSRGHSRV